MAEKVHTDFVQYQKLPPSPWTSTLNSTVRTAKNKYTPSTKEIFLK